MAGMLTTTGGGSLFLSVGSKKYRHSRTAQGTDSTSNNLVNGPEKPFGLFLQFFDGLLLSSPILKHLIGDVQQSQDHQIDGGDNPGLPLDLISPLIDEIGNPLNVFPVSLSPYIVFSAE